MISYIIKRIVVAIPLLFAILLTSFLLLYALPGDPVDVLLGKNYTPEQAKQLRKQEGLDQPIYVQFGRYLSDVSQGNLGTNMKKKPVIDEIKVKLPATIELAVLAMMIASCIGITAGIISALKPRGWTDMATLTVSLAGVSMPIFFLALLAQRAFRSGGWLTAFFNAPGLPIGGRLSETTIASLDKIKNTAEIINNAPLPVTNLHIYDALFVFKDMNMLADALTHLILPAIVLATVPTAIIVRITRTAVGQQLSQDYIRTAKAKGLRYRTVIIKHALRNSLIPIVTTIGTQLGYLLGGAVLTETIFKWPGMGTYIVDAIIKGDARPLQAGVLIIAVAFICINLLIDLSYAFLDPRVKSEATS